MSASTSADQGEARAPDIDTVVIGNTTWTVDIRITHNSAEDWQPQIMVDTDDNAHIIWERSGYWTKVFDNRGQALVKEIFITPHVVNGYNNPYKYPLGPQIALDSENNMHVVWDDGANNVFYLKHDDMGNPLMQPIHVGPNDNVGSHCPSVAVDTDDDVHIVHEDYIYQCEDILYGKRDNDGKVLVNEHSLSSAVSSHCEHSTLTTDGSGNVHVVFGSAIGCWWRKVDNRGLAQGQAVKIKGPPAYMVADVACTPNGDVHLAWTSDETVRYSRMDNNGTFLDENITISKDAVAPGPPRIAASNNDESVHIVWNDLCSGNNEIYYAKVEEGRFNQTPDNIRLTDDASISMLPWVDVSSNDDVYVVWSDNRDGNWEVYYKFMYGFSMDLGVVNIAELADMYFFHPEETQTMDLYIDNKGLLPDDYDIEFFSDAWAMDSGWDLYPNVTRFEEVEGGTRVLFRVTVTSPSDAKPGDYVNFTVRATAASGDEEAIEWRAFIIVERSVLLECDEPTRLITSGETVRFDLTVTNDGDVPDTYRVYHTLLPEDAGWEVDVETETVDLDVDESVGLSVNLSAPASASTNENGTVFIRVQSMFDVSVWDGKKLLAVVDPTLHLEMEAPVPSMLVDPGGTVEFPIIVRNAGNMDAGVTVYVTSSEPRPGWNVVLDSGEIDLAGGEGQVLTLAVSAPTDAVAGTVQEVKVSAVTGNLASSANVEVTAVVDEVHAINPVFSSMPPKVHAGEEARYELVVTNEGNSAQVHTLGSALVPDGWSISYEAGGQDIVDLALDAMETRTLDVVVSTPYGAKAGDSPEMNVVLTDAAGRSITVPFQIGIYAFYAVDISAPVHEGGGGPGGTVTFPLTVHNMGNGPDTFLLDHGPLPGANWEAVFHATDGTPVTSLRLEGGEEVTVDLRVRIPEDGELTEPYDLVVSALSTSSEVDEVKLVLSVRLPDLKIVSIEYLPASTMGTHPVNITVVVENGGGALATGVTLVMFVDDVEVDRKVLGDMEAGSTRNASCLWKPKIGQHRLTFDVSCDSAEAEVDNNVVVHRREYEDDSVDGPGFSILLVLFAMSCLLVGAWVRRRR